MVIDFSKLKIVQIRPAFIMLRIPILNFIYPKTCDIFSVTGGPRFIGSNYILILLQCGEFGQLFYFDKKTYA